MLRKLLLACLTASALLFTGCAPDADPGGRAPAASTPASPGAFATPAWAEGMDTVTPDRLPPEARETLRLIDERGPYPYDKDNSVFGNYERRLPARERGHYREYTVRTPGARDRGARRIVAGRDGERYWTSDHYKSFKAVVQP